MTCEKYGKRPLIIEIQHSPMDKETINTRESYYQNMIWLFDLTPRVVKRGEHNKIVFVDGKVSYLMDKVSYVAHITSGPSSIRIQTSDEYYTGDECISEKDINMTGIFIIINTRTKYWFETTKPTYFDTGFGILRMIRKLDKGFCLTQYISYTQFFKERMPPLDEKTLSNCEWFHSLSPIDLIKIGMMPKIIDIPPIIIAPNKLCIKCKDNKLECLGLERGMDDWHFGSFYIKKEELSVMKTLLLQVTKGHVPSKNTIHNEAVVIMRARKYLGASMSVIIEIDNYRSINYLKVICSKETFSMKDKFKALGMSYRRGSRSNNGDDRTPSYWNIRVEFITKKLDALSN